MIVLKLAVSYLKKQRGKTIALITSISLAVILVFALNVIEESQWDSNINRIQNSHGDYHAFYNDVDEDVIQKIKREKDVKSVNDMMKFGNLVSIDNGTSMIFSTYNKEFLDSCNYKLSNGRAPQNSNEIVIEEKALEAMGKELRLNQSIDLEIVNHYLDQNDMPQIYSRKNAFEVVGIVTKSKYYYKALNGFELKAFTYSTNGEDIVPKELIKHMGTIYLNTKNINDSKINKIAEKYKLTSDQLYTNAELLMAISNKNLSMRQGVFDRKKLLPIIAATLVISNIFNIILSDITNQVGVLRSIGMNKKNVRNMVLIQNLIITVIGIIVGLILGLILSFIGLKYVFDDSATLYISSKSWAQGIIMPIAAVLISSIIPIYSAGKISIIDAIRKNDRVKKTNKLFLFKKTNGYLSVPMIMAFKNLFRNKIRTILTIITISLAGILFIEKVAYTKLYDSDEGDTTNIMCESYGNFDIYLCNEFQNTELALSKYEDKTIEDLKKIENVADVEPSIFLEGYLNESPSKLTKDYMAELNRREDVNTVQTPLLARGYSNELLKNIDKYIQEGTNIYSKQDQNSSGEYPEALLVNNFYSRVETSNKTNVFKSLKIGDLVNIKIPVYKDGIEKYIDTKVRVSGIMDDLYTASQDGEAQFCGAHVILKEKDLVNLTGKKGYNKVFMRINKDTDKEVIEDIKELTKNSGITRIEGRYTFRHLLDEENILKYKLTMTSVSLILIISCVNIIFLVRSNILVRIKEICMFRAIGMSVKNVKKMIIGESVMYGIMGALLASIISSIKYNKSIRGFNADRMNAFGGGDMIKYRIPIEPIAIFLIVSILICIFAVYFSNKKIDELSIVEGIKGDE